LLLHGTCWLGVCTRRLVLRLGLRFLETGGLCRVHGSACWIPYPCTCRVVAVVHVAWAALGLWLLICSRRLASLLEYTHSVVVRFVAACCVPCPRGSPLLLLLRWIRLLGLRLGLRLYLTSSLMWGVLLLLRRRIGRRDLRWGRLLMWRRLRWDGLLMWWRGGLCGLQLGLHGRGIRLLGGILRLLLQLRCYRLLPLLRAIGTLLLGSRPLLLLIWWMLRGRCIWRRCVLW
jgi:hypothetical protein